MPEQSKRKFFKIVFKKSYEADYGVKYTMYDADEFVWEEVVIGSSRRLVVRRKDNRFIEMLSISMSNVDKIVPVEL